MPYRVHDILDHWLAQHAITAEQHAAGRHFLRLYDRTIRGSSVIDPERIAVDGGRRAPAAEQVLVARGELDEIARLVGRLDFVLLCRVLGTGRDLKGDTPDEAERRYLARRLRDALGVIANRDRIMAVAS